MGHEIFVELFYWGMKSYWSFFEIPPPRGYLYFMTAPLARTRALLYVIGVSPGQRYNEYLFDNISSAMLNLLFSVAQKTARRITLI